MIERRIIETRMDHRAEAALGERLLGRINLELALAQNVLASAEGRAATVAARARVNELEATRSRFLRARSAR